MAICRKCKGNAQFLQRIEDDDGMVELTTQVCDKCQGTGAEPDIDDNGQVFDPDEYFDFADIEDDDR